MRNFSSTLWAGTAVVLALAAAPSAAQTTAQTGPAPVGDSTAAPAQADAAAASDDSIVVTGIRKSLESAKNLKKKSNQIVDAIVAEDIGKLPDIAVSDTAARIPGVQVERGGGEAGRVLVRGLPDFTTTYNGREIFTAETRQVALQDFPAGAIAAVEVYKSSAADLVEAGLAGLINVRSRRPFDFKGREIAGSVWGVYPLVSRDLTPVVLVSKGVYAMAVHPSMPVNTVGELAALAKANPDKYNAAMIGAGAPPHLALTQFTSMTGSKIVGINYKGAGPAMAATVAGETQLLFSSYATMQPMVEAGRLRVIAVTSAKRTAAAPQVPTATESGLPGFVFDEWYAIFAPAKTPRVAIEPAAGTPEALGECVRTEMARFSKLITENNIKVE